MSQPEAVAILDRSPPPPAGTGPPGPWPSEPAVTTIEPPSGWQWVDVGELWRSRELVYFLAWRDVKVRYKQTVLGAAWAVLQPLVTMIIFAVFFAILSRVPTEGIP